MRREIPAFLATFGSERYRVNLFLKKWRLKFRHFFVEFWSLFGRVLWGENVAKNTPLRYVILYFFVFFWELPGWSSHFYFLRAVTRAHFAARGQTADVILPGKIFRPVTFCIFVNLGPKVLAVPMRSNRAQDQKVPGSIPEDSIFRKKVRIPA